MKPPGGTTSSLEAEMTLQEIRRLVNERAAGYSFPVLAALDALNSRMVEGILEFTETFMHAVSGG